MAGELKNIMTERKILFLDFDDVLNTVGTLERGQLFENANIEALNAILDRTDAQLVVTSTWRVGATLEELEELLVEAGVHAAGRVVGSTPWLTNCPRGAEIMAWLDEASAPVRYVILDNRTDMGACAGHLVRTDPRCGLVPGQVDEVVGMLGGAAV
jgi:hypothetical protein